MTDHDPTPLPATLRDLIADEQRAPSAGDAERSAIRARLHGTLGVAPILGGDGGASGLSGAGGTGGGAGLAGGAKLAIALTTTAVLAGGGIAIVASTGDRTASTPAPTAPALAREPLPPPIERVENQAAPPTLEPEPVVIEPAPPKRARARGATPKQSPIAITARAEAAIVGDATRALSRHAPAEALAFLDEHARAYPAGALAEERDALRIEALLASNRTADARAHAERFHARYPNSVHRALVTRALAKDSQ